FYLSSRPPYGYRKIRFKDGEKERTKLEIDPNQAGIVSSMFNDVLNGKGLTEIAKELNRKGIDAPRGKGWGKTGIRTILANEAYAGTFVWGRNSKRGLTPIRVENACPEIVTRSVFDSAQALIKDRAPKRLHPKRASSRFLLSGFTFCGHCGKAMIGQDAKSGKFSYYVCGTLNKKGAGSCPSHYFNSRAFEETVVKVIREKILTEEHLTRLVEMVNLEMDVNSKEYQNELDAVLEEMNDTDRRLERLYDAVENGKVPLADLAPRIHDLRLRTEKLQERKVQVTNMLSDRRVELASPEIVKSYVKDMRRLLEESELTGKRSFLRGFIKKIDVIDRQGVIHYLLPINGVLEERIGVLPIVQYGGQ
ncbi:recombinase family protein, partial [Dehalococcoides sp.]|uniref:recombinase family protein n=1 Tax=Dehalococcoides sp. TaxID=1966486 RepID=UPI003567E179